MATSRKFEKAVQDARAKIDRDTLRELGEAIEAVIEYRHKFGHNPDLIVEGEDEGCGTGFLTRGRRAR